MAGGVTSRCGDSSPRRGTTNRHDRKHAQQGPGMESQLRTRGVFWVDAVGGFLVTLKDEIMLGQAVPDSVPIFPFRLTSVAATPRFSALVRIT